MCRAPLEQQGASGFRCTSSTCAAEYPMVSGIPVLLNESNSLFRISDFQTGRDTFYPSYGKLHLLLTNAIPQMESDPWLPARLSTFAGYLRQRTPHPLVLNLGGSQEGNGIEVVGAQRGLELVDSDVALGPRTSIIVDAHDIPFEDETFDGIIARAVLEHVVDPYRCVSEIYRVLKPGGLVYAETPFLAPQHFANYDFTRFTANGHRRLFRMFDEVQSGMAKGPGNALGLAYKGFLTSFGRSEVARAVLAGFARCTGFWFRYFDYYLRRQPRSLESATSCYFIGAKRTTPVDDRDLLAARFRVGAPETTSPLARSGTPVAPSRHA